MIIFFLQMENLTQRGVWKLKISQLVGTNTELLPRPFSISSLNWAKTVPSLSLKNSVLTLRQKSGVSEFSVFWERQTYAPVVKHDLRDEEDLSLGGLCQSVQVSLTRGVIQGDLFWNGEYKLARQGREKKKHGRTKPPSEATSFLFPLGGWESGGSRGWKKME